MPSGILGLADLAANTNSSVYTVPAATTASFSVNFTNRGASSTLIRLSVCTTSTPANSEFVIFDAVLNPDSSIERTGLVAQAGKIVVASSTNANVSVQVYGYEA